MRSDPPKAEELTPYSEYRGHLLNALQFSGLTNLEGGASFNTSTNKFLKVGQDKVYVVGGEPDTHGVRIPTTKVQGPRVGTNAAMAHIASVRHKTGNRPDAVAGSWVVPGDRVDLDASGMRDDRNEALRIANRRNEEAIWDNKNGVDILADAGIAKRRAKGS